MSSTSFVINFNRNYNNKLNCDSFITMRLHDPVKYVTGRFYKIRLNGALKGVAVLKSKRTISVNQIDSFISHVDVGCGVNGAVRELKNIYEGLNQHTKIDLCLLSYNCKPKQPKQKKLEL